MALDSLRDRIMLFLRRTLLWIVGVVLVVLTMAILLAPLSVAERLDSIAPVIRSLLAILLGVSFLAFLYIQLRQRSGPEATGLMVRTSGAITQVDIESTRERILHAVSSLPDIVSAKVEVRAVRGKADIELDVVVGSDEINVPKKQKEIDRALKQVVNKQLGLHMANRPRMHIRFDAKPPEPKQKVIEKPVVGSEKEVVAKNSVDITPDRVESEPKDLTQPADEKTETQPEAKSAGGFLGTFRLGHGGEDVSKSSEEPEKLADEETIQPVAAKDELFVDEPTALDTSLTEDELSAALPALMDKPADDVFSDDDLDTESEEDPDSKI